MPGIDVVYPVCVHVGGPSFTGSTLIVTGSVVDSGGEPLS